MKIVLVFAVLVSKCLLLSSFLAQISLAAPTLQAIEDLAVASVDIKRNVEYRNSLFSGYICCVMTAADAVRTILQVTEY